MKIHIISGFLGSGKTTFIKSIIPKMTGKIALIENEFGDVSIDGMEFGEDIAITDIYSGCICCSLVGDFYKSIIDIQENITPDHLIIEPSGVANLSDLIKICNRVVSKSDGRVSIGEVITLVDVRSFEDYYESFGSFYGNQIAHCKKIVYSHNKSDQCTNGLAQKIKSINAHAMVYEEAWSDILPLNYERLMKSDSQEEKNLKHKKDMEEVTFEGFESYTMRNLMTFDDDSLDKFIQRIKEAHYGDLLRVKGITKHVNGSYKKLNFTKLDFNVTECSDDLPVLVFIGSNLKKDAIRIDLCHRFFSIT